MKKNVLSILLLSFLMASCGENTNESKNQESEKESVEVISSSEEANNPYKTTVLLPDGSPVSNAKVLWCTTGNCFAPVKTDANGVAINDLADNTYYVHTTDYPEGYTYNPNIYTVDADNKEIVINLLPLSNYISGDGSVTSPYILSEGYYDVTFNSSSELIYFGFNVKEAGTYVIESLATDLLATKPIDPYFGYVGSLGFISSQLVEDDNSGIGKNFKYEVEITDTSLTYYFEIMGLINGNTSYPSSYCFGINKK